jgi:RNA polymerase sigma-70 factor (ECF subfamily)
LSTSGPDRDSANDRALAAAFLKTRSEAAFRALYARHASVVWGFARRLLPGREADAEDVLQEVWLRALRALPAFRWDSSLRSWLCGIAVNCARERWRERPFEQVEASVAAPTEPRETEIDLGRALERLSEGYREVVLLHDVMGYTHEEIAEILDIEAGTSKSQLSRGRAALRTLLPSE